MPFLSECFQPCQAFVALSSHSACGRSFLNAFRLARLWFSQDLSLSLLSVRILGQLGLSSHKAWVLRRFGWTILVSALWTHFGAVFTSFGWLILVPAFVNAFGRFSGELGLGSHQIVVGDPSFCFLGALGPVRLGLWKDFGGRPARSVLVASGLLLGFGLRLNSRLFQPVIQTCYGSDSDLVGWPLP